MDLNKAAATLAEERDRLVAAFNYLEEKGELTLKVAELRHRYHFKNRPSDIDGLAGKLHARFRDSESRDLQRIRQVVDVFATVLSMTGTRAEIRQNMVWILPD